MQYEHLDSKREAFYQDVCLIQLYSLFSPCSENSLSYIFQHWEKLHFYLWPPIDHPGSGVRFKKRRSQSSKPRGSISTAGMKSTWRMWESSGNGKGWRGEIYFCCLAPGPEFGPAYWKRPPRLKEAQWSLLWASRISSNPSIQHIVGGTAFSAFKLWLFNRCWVGV